jgi:kynureninase
MGIRMPVDLKQAANTLAIQKAISLFEEVTYETVSTLIPQMLANKSLIIDASAYYPDDLHNENGVGRFLIYEHQEHGNQFSIWAFAFAPEQKTCIHAHRYRGTVTVLQNILSEKYYTLVDKDNAVLSEQNDRLPFHTNHDNMDILDRAHQLEYRKSQASPGTVAVSLHIYDMPAYKSADQHNRNLLRSFDKEPLDTSQDRPEYTLMALS